jgi:hypothetical protein
MFSDTAPRAPVNDASISNAPVVNGEQESRQMRWQRVNRERYNEKMREYMRQRRAAGRAS